MRSEKEKTVDALISAGAINPEHREKIISGELSGNVTEWSKSALWKLVKKDTDFDAK